MPKSRTARTPTGTTALDWSDDERKTATCIVTAVQSGSLDRDGAETAARALGLIPDGPHHVEDMIRQGKGQREIEKVTGVPRHAIETIQGSLRAKIARGEDLG